MDAGRSGGRVHRTITSWCPLGHKRPARAVDSASYDQQPCGPALPLDGVPGLQARRSARPRAPGVRDAAGGGLRPRQAARDGLRDDHRSRHDRWRPGDRRSPGRLRLRGADGPVPRRAAGRAHPLLRDHARRSRVAAGACVRRRGRGRLPARALDRVRAGPPLLRGRGAAAAAPPAPAGAALRRLGGAQRLARSRAQPPGGDLRRDPRRRRRRRVRRPRGRRHRPHLVADAVRPGAVASSSPTCERGA